MRAIATTPAIQIKMESQVRKAERRNIRHARKHDIGLHEGKPVLNCPACDTKGL